MGTSRIGVGVARSMSSMRYQVVLPNESPAMEAERLLELAVQAEKLGYDTVWLPEHVLPPEPYGTTYGGVYEPLISLAAIAARTRRIRIGTSVLILPLRDPFVLAKQAATLDRISGGRLVLGVGVGWDAAEYANVGADFGGRGRRSDRMLALLRHLWSSDQSVASGYDGEEFGFERGVFAPRPHDPRGVRLMVGGTSRAALRRVAEFGDEWQAVGVSPARFFELLGELRANTGDRAVVAGSRLEWAAGTDPAAAVVEAQEWAAAGAEQLAVWFGPADGFADRMERFATATDLHK